MARVREEATVQAPVADIWRAMHVDLADAQTWSDGQVRLTALSPGDLGQGSLVRWDLALNAGLKTSLVLRTETWTPPSLCAGVIVEGPISGRWSYEYSQRADATLVACEMDYEFPGLLRFTGGLFSGQFAEGIRQGLEAMRVWVEGGRSS
ncbi:MAG: SRPBCC family protein [Candidatus Dormibacteraeota bacterium]|nr:SRPBCC family protein [Candidatus Dormibacteraeota bacterium]